VARIVFAYTDNQGKRHDNPEAAVVADLSVTLGRLGAESGITSGLAKLLIEKRGEIEVAFADLDRMTAGVLPDPIKLQTLGGENVEPHA
jgi:hypothetical protein